MEGLPPSGCVLGLWPDAMHLVSRDLAVNCKRRSGNEAEQTPHGDGWGASIRRTAAGCDAFQAA